MMRQAIKDTGLKGATNAKGISQVQSGVQGTGLPHCFVLFCFGCCHFDEKLM
jgi:hypothetical protein